MTEREQFEAWWAKEDMPAYVAGVAWNAWQAARADCDVVIAGLKAECERLNMVIDARAAPEVSETGPWRAVRRSVEGRPMYVESDDFTHDVRLVISGDFADDEQEFQYAQEIARRLNARAAPAQTVDCAHCGKTFAGLGFCCERDDCPHASNRVLNRAAPAQPAERVLLRRGTNLGAMGVGTGPWMQVFDQNDTYNDAEFAWATVERIK